jgi:hypothetical protein
MLYQWSFPAAFQYARMAWLQQDGQCGCATSATCKPQLSAQDYRTGPSNPVHSESTVLAEAR